MDQRLGTTNYPQSSQHITYEETKGFKMPFLYPEAYVLTLTKAKLCLEKRSRNERRAHSANITLHMQNQITIRKRKKVHQ